MSRVCRIAISSAAGSQLQHMMPEEQEELELARVAAARMAPVSDRCSQSDIQSFIAGMSFCVDGAATALHVTARWVAISVSTAKPSRRLRGSTEMVWKRQPMGVSAYSHAGRSAQAWAPEPEEQPEVEVQGLCANPVIPGPSRFPRQWAA